MLDTARRRAMLRQMVLVRAFEEKLEELYQRKAMFGNTHSYRGREAVAVGVCSGLQATDLIASYHRGTGHLIAKGADLYTLLCECMGREDGYSKGRGGNMHMGDMAFGFIGNTGTVGGTVPTATGVALSAKVRGSKEVVVSFFGDGAANQGVVHESMNLAGVWKLPVIYVCENSQYAMTVSLEKSVAVKQLSVRGATFLECVTYRWDGHFGGDPGSGYRTKEEVEAWKQKCPIKRLKEKLVAEGRLTEEEFQKSSETVYAELEAVVERGEAAPLPKKEVDLSAVYAASGVSHD